MVTLANLKRTYKVQMLLAYIPFLASLVISYSNVLPKDLIDYKVLLILILLILPLLYSYILLLKNHIEDLEMKVAESTISQSSPIQQEPEKLRPSEIHHRLQNLSEKEKELLRRFFQEDTRTLRLHYDNPIADGLRLIGILEVSSVVSTMRKFSYSINPIYWDYVKKKPDVIGL